jgi:hypothetical protein
VRIKVRSNVFRASLPLSDSEQATVSLACADFPLKWRLECVAAISSLRIIGHVLHKVDAQAFPEIREELRRRFNRWKLGQGDNQLFTDFIEPNRNNLLKLYQFPADDITAFAEDDEGMFPSGITPDVLCEGPFAGCNLVSLLRKSHSWWRSELNELADFIDIAPIESMLKAKQD